MALSRFQIGMNIKNKPAFGMTVQRSEAILLGIHAHDLSFILQVFYLPHLN